MITQSELKELVHYNDQTGIFTWKKSRKGCAIGSVAGSLHLNGYIYININYKKYLAHRLAWVYQYKEFPANEIDHIDGNKSNNKIENLRNATRSENLRNTTLNVRNKSGHKNISLHKPTGLWRAVLTMNKHIVINKYFKNIDDAVNFIKEKREEYHGNFYRDC